MQGIHSWFSFVKSFLVHRGQKQKQTSIDLPLIRKMDRTFLRNHLKLKNNWEVVSILERHSYLVQLKLWNCDLKCLSDWFSPSAHCSVDRPCHLSQANLYKMNKISNVLHSCIGFQAFLRNLLLLFGIG